MGKDGEERAKRSAWVSASPGTGKSQIFIQRIIRLLLAGTDPSRIAYFAATEAEVENFKRRLSRNLTKLFNATDKELEQEIRQVTTERCHQQMIERVRSLVEKALNFGASGISAERVGTFLLNSKTFDHILVDRPEHLNQEHWELIKGLSETGRLFGEGNSSIFFVGDDTQSIFTFPKGGSSSPTFNLFDHRRRELHRKLSDHLSFSSSALETVDAVFAKELSQLSKSSVLVGSLVIPERKTTQGLLIKSTSVAWIEIAERLRNDWSIAYQIPANKWEEMIAGAYSRAGFDEVILTPRSRDHGRDIIAIRRGIGCIKIVGSVKAYKPGKLVRYDDVRALAGVLLSELDASKGIISTTSDFPPKILSDPLIAPLMPTRLELMNGTQLQSWLASLLTK